MILKLPLKDCKLWWPAWQQGVPFTNYGYRKEVSGEGYWFRVDPEMDSWLCPGGEIMPISTSKLCSGEGPLAYSSFSTLGGNRVQVNRLIDPKSQTYSVRYYSVEELYFEGEAYSDDE